MPLAKHWREFYTNLLKTETSQKYMGSLALALGWKWNSTRDPRDWIREVGIEFLNEVEKPGKPHRVLERSWHHVEDCRGLGGPGGRW